MKKFNIRIKYIDIAKGIAILLMIMGHVVGDGFLRKMIFSFHMPLFIITSGYFYKYRNIKDEFKKIFFKLLMPTVIITFVVTFIKNLSNTNVFISFLSSIKTILFCWSHQRNISYSCYSVDVLWFVFALVIIRLLFVINVKIAKQNDFKLICLIIFGSYLGYLLGIKGLWLPWSIDVVLVGLIFYLFGFLSRKYDYFTKIKNDKLIILLIFLFWIVGIYNNNIEMAVRWYPNGLWSVFTALCGSFVFLLISYIIEKKSDLIKKGFEWCGMNSLYILYGHYIESNFIPYASILPNGLYTNIILIIIKIMISILIALIFNCAVKLIKKINFNFQIKKHI